VQWSKTSPTKFMVIFYLHAARARGGQHVSGVVRRLNAEKAVASAWVSQ
jgi:hypothetical protein